MYHNGSYLRLFREENLKILKFHVNNSFYFQISSSLLSARHFIRENTVCVHMKHTSSMMLTCTKQLFWYVRTDLYSKSSLEMHL